MPEARLIVMRGKHVEKYILGAVLPYLLLALVILSSMLVTQQSARFAEIIGGARAPWDLLFDVLLSLLPNILVFTLPMAMLVGTATGFSRLGSDSELTAMRAAGIGTWRILVPVLGLGLVVSILTLYTGFELAPPAAQNLKEAGMRAALYRLESPVEPGSFNTELSGKVIYVRGGDDSQGIWENVFIYWQEPNKAMRLITSRSGRIDVSGERSELLLTDAVVTTFLSGGPETITRGAEVTTERSDQLRVRDDRLNSSRQDLLKKLQERQLEPDEMGWRQLIEQSRKSNDPKQRRIVEVALNKRLSLCLSPLIFAFFGVGIGLHMRRGGRALGVGISIGVMLVYYLVSLAGEQLGRTGQVSPVVGAWSAFGVALLAGFLLIINKWGNLNGHKFIVAFKPKGQTYVAKPKEGRRRIGSIGLLDKSIFKTLSQYFVSTFVVMIFVFFIFTIFEMLRFITWTASGLSLFLRYMLFLLPLVCVSVAPLATLIAVLITFALLVRRSEAIAWWASGQSAYRLVLPAIIFAMIVGATQWQFQEKILPAANRRQNALRSVIRSRGSMTATALTNRQRWLATPNSERLYSYVPAQEAGVLDSPVIYEFDSEGVHLSRIIVGENASWKTSMVMNVSNPKVIEFSDTDIKLKQPEQNLSLDGTDENYFLKPPLNKPAESAAAELRDYLRTLNGQEDDSLKATLSVALERKMSDPFAPLVMTFIGIPLALAFGRRGALAALFVAVFVGLLFWAATSGLQQLGVNGMLSAKLAAWGPPAIFTSIGIYLLTRSHT
ncbi:MAG: LptF/LptG family permease [Pyrinomonadaceae bacterium]